ncbi:hypothetical protein GCM10028778_12520 [Barrientosiimonas marina]|uniref:Uncharacterized protein n=1 Tax=Lentibacillus kimchii TaxID=1542911 RepID=A0ABW2UXN5_9BACI
MNKKTFRNAAISTMAVSATVAAVAPAAVSADNQVDFVDIDQSNTHYESIMALA